MKNQTAKPDQWIIVDDGVTEFNEENLPEFSEYYYRIPVRSADKHSIGSNLEIALRMVKFDKIIIMEDDDWYSPFYVSFMVELLSKSELAGLWGTNYYHVKVPGWREMGRNTHAALSMTAFRKSFIPQIIKSIPGDISIDLRIWKNNKGLLVEGRNKKLQLSIKGMPGRENAGVGKIQNRYTKDPEYKKLVEWCDDAQVYIDLMEKNLV
jgi:hypothetical protein